jgi:hypothetical protein
MVTGEAQILVSRDPNDGEAMWKLKSRSKFKLQSHLNLDLLDFLVDLQEKVVPFMEQESIDIFTCHQRDNQKFRAHPNYRGKGPWRDWAWVNWDSWGNLPSHIWCFVDLKALNRGHPMIKHGGINVKSGVYAVVETAIVHQPAAADVPDTEALHTPIIKDGVIADDDGLVHSWVFYLADVEAILGPCCVVPHIGGPFNRYFVVRPRTEWNEVFIRWLESPHKDDGGIEMSDEEV